MYYNSNNDSHSQEPWDRPIETTGRSLDNEYVPDEPGHSGKKKGRGGKTVALCLVCALVGGAGRRRRRHRRHGRFERRYHHDL